MASPTNHYVDPAIAADSGTGTIGDPFGDFQYALNTITRDATNGDQINVKAGTTEFMAGAVDLTAYGVPVHASPLIVRGYTAVANDGGFAVIDGANLGYAFTTPTNWTHVRNLHMKNVGANYAFYFGVGSSVDDCEVEGATGTYAVRVGNYSQVMNSYIHDLGGTTTGIYAASYNRIEGNFVDIIYRAIYLNISSHASFNVFKVSGTATDAVWSTNVGNTVVGNSIYHATGNGSGSGIYAPSTQYGVHIRDNIIEGFNGTGEGIYTGTSISYIGNNRFFNCSPNITGTARIMEDNLTLAASAFADPASNDFTVSEEFRNLGRLTHIGGSRILTTPTFVDLGAAQLASGGGGLMKIGQGGGYNG